MPEAGCGTDILQASFGKRIWRIRDLNSPLCSEFKISLGLHDFPSKQTSKQSEAKPKTKQKQANNQKPRKREKKNVGVLTRIELAMCQLCFKPLPLGNEKIPLGAMFLLLRFY